MKVELMTVTPQMASDFLATNGHNRAINPLRVRTLAAAMRSGEWQINGETIIISKTMELLDGQHRLKAVMEYGRPVQMLVAFDVESEAFKTIDTGRARSCANILAMNGFRSSNTLAASARMLWQMFHHQTSFTIPPASYMVKVAERYPEMGNWADRTNGKGVSTILPPAALVLACTYLERIVGRPARAEEFFKGITEGAGLQEGSPVLALRNRIINLRSSGSKLNSASVWGVTAKALSYFEEGRLVKMLRMDQSLSGPLPVPDIWEAHVRALTPSERLVDLLPPEFVKRA